jgi:hypothetical protein
MKDTTDIKTNENRITYYTKALVIDIKKCKWRNSYKKI